jgi:hypothetical protein
MSRAKRHATLKRSKLLTNSSFKNTVDSVGSLRVKGDLKLPARAISDMLNYSSTNGASVTNSSENPIRIGNLRGDAIEDILAEVVSGCLNDFNLHLYTYFLFELFELSLRT